MSCIQSLRWMLVISRHKVLSDPGDDYNRDDDWVKINNFHFFRQSDNRKNITYIYSVTKLTKNYVVKRHERHRTGARYVTFLVYKIN